MPAQKRPNFLLVIADDLGYSDIGCFGGEIETPHIDAMAKNGLLFTDFHASAACSPTRAMLLSGTDNHLAGMGVMSEQRGNDVERWDKPGHEGYMNFDVASLPEILNDGGYYNMISGKWHLGFKQECNPHARGFHRSLAMLPGTTNHFAFEPQLGKDDWNEFFGRIPVLYTEQGKRKVFETNAKNEYDTGFYSTSYYTDNLIRYFEERTEEDKEKPFFAMLPFSAPHWPLQCSKADREKYKGKYDDGPAALRERRLAKLKELGIIAKDVVPHEVIPESNPGIHYPSWEEMSEFERGKSARAMECFAGMVDCIDQNVGKMKEYLEKIGELDNTFIVFMADNGAEGSALEAFPVMGENIMKVVRKYYDNKLENMGNHNSFVWYGPRWAQASTAPSKLYKMYSTEGGIRVPFVVQYPNGWPKNQMTRGFATVMDLAPTILELAGLKHPVPSGQIKGQYKGREVYGIRGKSWVKSLSTGEAFVDKPDVFWGDEEFVGWELFGRAAVRKGKWKITYMPIASWGKDQWELFDLSVDPGETNDLASTHPEKLEELKKDWEEYVKQTGTVWGGPVSTIRESWFSTPATSIGGDAFEQQDAWMEVGEGGVPKATLPRYNEKLIRETA